MSEVSKSLDRADRLELYKLLVEMADRVSQRRQAANNFYLSVNTLLIGGAAYLGTIRSGSVNIWIISIAGISMCAMWYRNILSYKTLNEAKFSVINRIEEDFEFKPFVEEWKILAHDRDGKRHRPFHAVEGVIPWIFVFVYLVQAASLAPWQAIGRYLFCR